MSVSPAALEALMAGAAEHAVIDVREKGEAEGGHVPGVTVVPRRLLESMLPELVRRRDTPVVFVDDDGARARLAARTAAEIGYSAATSLRGGLEAWRGAGLEVSQGVNVPSKRFGEHVARDLGVSRIEPSELQQWIAQGRAVAICDARTPAEYREGTIPGAVSVPNFELWSHARALLSRNKALVVTCAGRTRSLLGARTLIELGHDRVFALENGTMGWLLAGQALEQGADRALVKDEADPQAEWRVREWGVGEGVPLLSPRDVAERFLVAAENNAQVFDLRAAAAYESGHLAGAKNMPSGQLVQRVDDFIAVRAAPILLVDDREARAIAAAVWLRRMGFAGAAVLEGGMASWNGPRESGRRSHAWWGLEKLREQVSTVGAGELEAAVRERDVRVISVDPSSRYRQAHVPGATWVPRGRLEMRIAPAAPDRDRPLVVTCRDGIQSLYAAAALAQMGYTQVRALAGGVAGWKRQGFEAATGGGIEDDGDTLTPPYKKGEAGMRAYLEWEQRL